MLDQFKLHPDIYRAVIASSDPLNTLHNIRNGKYSYKTLDMLMEIFDAKDTIEENALANRKDNKK